MNPQELESLRIAYLDPRMVVRSDATSGTLALRAYKSIEEIPISEDFIDINHYKDELGEDGVAFLVDFADKVQVAPDPYTVFAKNLPENVQELAPGVVEMFKIEAAANNAQIMNSHTYAFANTVQIWDMAEFVALIDVADKEPKVLMLASKNDVQDEKLLWSVGFGVELLLGLLSILGLPKVPKKNLAKFFKKILENPVLKKAFSSLRKPTVGAVIAFISLLYPPVA